MEELRVFPDDSKSRRYQVLIPQLKSLVEAETDFIANFANIAAALHETFRFLWVGFYRAKGKELVLGPFQGPLACTRIEYGKGVCGKAWKEAKTIIVPDVNQFPGHIACNSQSRSEIVVPLFNTKNEVYGVLDIDSEHFSHFDETDRKFLEQIVALIRNENADCP